jgi:hypothetical protein
MLQYATDMKQELLAEVASFNTAMDDKEKQLERAKYESDLHYERSKQYEQKFHKMMKETNRSKFVSVLIDGDGMNFLDDFVGKGDQGGLDAAQALKNAVLKHLDSILPDRDPNTKVIVRVYANLKGLIRPYRDNDIIADPIILEAFVRGFNKYDPFFDFVDAGSGKECADEKLKSKSSM